MPPRLMGRLRARPLLADALLAGLLAAFSLVALVYANGDCDGACDSHRPSSDLMKVVAMPLAISPAL